MGRQNKRRDELGTTPLTAALTSVLRDLAGTQPKAHAELWARWRTVVGPEMYRRSFPVSLRGTTLVVGVSSSSWLQELSFLKSAILDRVAEEIGPGVVSEITLVLDPALAVEDAASAPERAAPPQPPGQAPNLEPELRADLERIADPELRAALERAIGASLPDDKRR
jgi:hypothetical protein